MHFWIEVNPSLPVQSILHLKLLSNSRMEFTIRRKSFRLNPEEELSAHPITVPKCFVAVQWSVGEVVGVEHAVAFETMSVLCFHLPRRRATSPRLFIGSEQASEGGEDHEMFLFLDVSIGFLLQRHGERLLVV